MVDRTVPASRTSSGSPVVFTSQYGAHSESACTQPRRASYSTEIVSVLRLRSCSAISLHSTSGSTSSGTHTSARSLGS